MVVERGFNASSLGITYTPLKGSGKQLMGDLSEDEKLVQDRVPCLQIWTDQAGPISTDLRS